MTTIATDGKSMAADGLAVDHCDTVITETRSKLRRLKDGRIAGGSGNSFDLTSWFEWLDAGKKGDCPVQSEQFAGLILSSEGVLWVDYKGRETSVPTPSATGSGQDYAYGAMEAGASPEQAVLIACKRDIHSGGEVTVLSLENALREVA